MPDPLAEVATATTRTVSAVNAVKPPEAITSARRPAPSYPRSGKSRRRNNREADAGEGEGRGEHAEPGQQHGPRSVTTVEQVTVQADQGAAASTGETAHRAGEAQAAEHDHDDRQAHRGLRDEDPAR